MKPLSDEHFMREALKEAASALALGEIPVGGIVVCGGRIIARSHNQTEQLTDATAHAEMLAVTAACNYLGSKYLDECTLYVTLEPCLMCAGALYWTQLQRLVFGAPDVQRGYRLVQQPVLHPKTDVMGRVMEEEAAALLTTFFQRIRE